MQKLDLHNWNRKEHFEFFSTFDEPFFGIVSEVDCTKAYHFSKNNERSFFAHYLHKTLAAVNKIPEFSYRILDKEVVVCEKVNSAPTIARPDGTFAFSFVEFDPDFHIFQQRLKQEIEEVQNSTGLRFSDDAKRLDAVHISSFPWHKLTGLTHSRNFKHADSVPKITFGKMYSIGNEYKLPLAINVHHGLMDGFHVAKFLEVFQGLLDLE
ncbi:chloramphenicol O-acetyltransferase type A [Gillisia mitskevichiae]|uniref:Chloramphenicol O-acetyltransferase type A n=1 Tax=Gillisia mitskevichiae TaxID=270921 RepID=A0A495PMM2_9FLAO|nr:chloramphenicol acetyltransferase [Gillisia mitskevichiae]RKS50728.1 chloramphenicol O-acetyltransferase type A [Gillisia mitskevichiae]